ncbi:MAG: VCBS repeat-containing protein, partial [Myxococcales bacterium]|nr:VCBS repeat-containing protein [Myxococcales bacterium]
SLEGVGENVDVNFQMGQMSFGIPIAVPSGHAGLSPSLRLSYSSGGGQGPVGLGWSLGVGSIERATAKGLPRYTTDDEIAADGGTELVRVAGSGAGPLTYRARFEGGFVRYTWMVASDYWKAEYPDGRVGYFGADATGLAAPTARVPGAGETFRWHLRELVDVHGHRLFFDYLKDSETALLERVRYAFDGSGAPRYRVELVYGGRPDVQSDCKSGVEVRLTKRLEKIEVFTQGSLLRRYELTYEPDAVTGGQSRLARVTQLGRDGVTAHEAKTALTYSASLEGCTSAACQPVVVTMDGPVGVDLSTGLADFIDMNGDALPDVLHTGPDGHEIFLNVWGKVFSGATPSNTAKGAGAPRLTTANTNLFDVDGDGHADLVAGTADGTVTLYRGTANGDWAPPTITDGRAFSEGGAGNRRYFDVDNDKRMDIITADETSTEVCLNRPDDVSGTCEVVESIGASFADGLSFADWNGDGLQDPVLLPAGGNLLSYRLNLGHGQWTEWRELTGLPTQSAPARFHDINGDALTDLVWLLPTEIRYQLNRNGRELGPVRSIPAPVIESGSSERFGDMNGNGSTDVVWVSPDGEVTYLDLFPVRPNLLIRIENGLGKVTRLRYGSTVQHAERSETEGLPWLYKLPNPMLTVDQVDTFVTLTGDDTGGLHEVKAVEYRDGYWDGVERRFRGFERVKVETTGDDSIDVGTLRMRFDTGRQSAARAGLLLEQETWSKGVRLQTAKHQYGPCAVEGVPVTEPPIEWVCKASSQLTLEEGRPAAEHVTTRDEWTYDGYGNVLLEKKLGVVTRGGLGCGACVDPTAFGEPCDDAGFQCRGDEVTTETTYVPVTATGGRWQLRLPCRSLQYGLPKAQATAQGLVKESETYYDGAPFVGQALCTATKGLVSRSRQRVDATTFIEPERVQFDAHGNPVAFLDANGNRRELDYDADGLLPKVDRILFVKATPPYQLEQRVSYDPVLEAVNRSTAWVRVEGGKDQTPEFPTTYRYDALGRLIAMAAPGDTLDAPTHEYAYLLGAPVSRIVTRTRSQAGQPTDLEAVQCFDGLGRVLQTRTKLAPGKYQVSGFSDFNTQGKERRRYQPYLGNSGSCDTTPPASGVLFEKIIYDGLGRPTFTVHPDGPDHGGTDSNTAMVYRPLLEEAWDEEDLNVGGPHYGTPTRTVKDGLDRVVRMERTVPGDAYVLRFPYDSLGHLRGWRDDVVPANEKFQYYDRIGRVVEVDDPDSGTTLFTYDAVGNLVVREDARGIRVRTVYDEANRPVERFAEADKPGTLVTTEYDRRATCTAGECDALPGRVAGAEWMSNGVSGMDRHTYDGRGRAVGLTRRIGEVTLSFGTVFDNADRLVRQDYPGGISVQNLLDGSGRLTSVPTYIPSLSYDARGSLGKVLYGNGVATEYAYDRIARLGSLRTTLPSGERVQDYGYTRDRVGNITEIADSNAGVEPSEAATYEYDALYRLVEARLDAGRPAAEVLTYAYNRIDNMTLKASNKGAASPEHVGAMVYGENGFGVHAPTTAGGVPIGYDLAGNRVSDGTQTFEWDHDGRLLRNLDSAQIKIELGYGPTVERVWKTEGGKRALYFTSDFEVREGVGVVSIRLGQDRVVRVETPAIPLGIEDLAPAVLIGGNVVGKADGQITAGDAWVAQRVGWVVEAELEASGRRMLVGAGAVTWMHANHIGTPSVVTEESGSVVERFGTFPYGVLRFTNGDGAIDGGFQGLEELGGNHDHLAAALHRITDRLRGSWLSADPFVEVLQNDISTSLLTGTYPNRLRAMNSNPLALRDPSGLAPNVAGASDSSSVTEALRGNKTLHELSDAYSGNDDRYFYTSHFGWVDKRHFFAAAAETEDAPYLGGLVLLGGLAVEIRQLVEESARRLGGDKKVYRSAFSPEDLPSNNAGVTFAQFLKEGESRAESFKRFMSVYGAKELSDIPDERASLPLADPSSWKSNVIETLPAQLDRDFGSDV